MNFQFIGFKSLSILFGIVFCFNCNAQIFESEESRSVKFGIVTDAHQDLFPNVEERLDEFINAAKKENVDFIIQLGDFCFPKIENKKFLEIWNSFKSEKYHVLGNHDMDLCSKQEAFDFWGMDSKKPYYSFDFGSFHFVILDPNNILKNDKYIPYHKGNYYSEGNNINYIDKEQLDWLDNDLLNTKKQVVIFSHQPLYNISNRNEVIEILNKINQNQTKKVLVWFSGDEHKNWYYNENSIHHIQINSLSYYWVGDKYSCDIRYSKEIQEQYPNLKKMIPYKDPLYCFVEIDLDVNFLKIRGKRSQFISPGPQELGIKEIGRPFTISPSIDDRIIFLY